MAEDSSHAPAAALDMKASGPSEDGAGNGVGIDVEGRLRGVSWLRWDQLSTRQMLTLVEDGLGFYLHESPFSTIEIHTPRNEEVIVPTSPDHAAMRLGILDTCVALRPVGALLARGKKP